MSEQDLPVMFAGLLMALSREKVPSLTHTQVLPCDGKYAPAHNSFSRVHEKAVNLEKQRSR